MNTEEPSDIQDIIRELTKSRNRLNRERIGPPLKEREAKAMIFFGINAITVLLILSLWQAGRL